MTDRSAGGAYLPRLGFDREGARDINGTYEDATLVNPQVQGSIDVDGPVRVEGAYQVFDTDPAVANLNIGQDELPSYTTGNNNTFIGLNAGEDVTTGLGNLGIGHSALGSLQTGDQNVAIGWDSQLLNVAASNNTSIGVDSLKNVLTGGNGNTAVGSSAGYSTTTGDDNVAVGVQALYTNQTGGQNVAVGVNALNQATASGTAGNIGIGYTALDSLTTGTRMVAVGYAAGHAMTTNGGGVFLGNLAGFYETAANKLFIDNTSRANEADARLKALIYGIFDAATASQRLTINARLACTEINEYADNAAAVSAGLAIGAFYRTGDALKVVHA